MATLVNKLDMTTISFTPNPSFSFDGGVCDCAIVKITTNATGASGVDYGGNAMTMLQDVFDSLGQTHQIWGLQDAPSGTVTVSITIGGAVTIGSVETYLGIDKTASFPNTSGSASHSLGSGSLTDIQVDLTTTTDTIIVGLGVYRGPGITFMSAGVNTTKISSNPPTGGTDVSFQSDPLFLSPAGLYSIQGVTGGGSPLISIALIGVALTATDTSGSSGGFFNYFKYA